MTDSADFTPLIAELEEVIADPDARPATKVAAIKQLTALLKNQTPERRPEDGMQAVVEKFCPPVDGLEDAPADPMRDLDVGADHVEPLYGPGSRTVRSSPRRPPARCSARPAGSA